MRASGINRAFMQARSLSAAPVIAASIAAGIHLGSEGNAQSASGACAIALPASAPARFVAANSVLSIFPPSPTGPPIPHRHSVTFPLSILRLTRLFVRRAPERVPGRQPSSLLRFAELQDELVGVSANRLVEHFGRAGVRRIGENRTLGVELEARGFGLSAHGRGLDAMQGLGYICGRAESGGMIENYIYAAGLQRTVDGLVKRGDVDRAHELVV